MAATLLAGQQSSAISALLSVHPDVVRWFEALFFAVSDRLHATDWVAATVIGPEARRGFTAAELGKLWMAFAYHGGEHVLDVILAVSSDAEQHRRRQKAYGASTLRSAELAVAAMMIPIDAPMRRLAEVHLRMRALEKSATCEAPRDTTSRLLDEALEVAAAAPPRPGDVSASTAAVA